MKFCTSMEWLHRGKPTALGFASGVVAGLVAVTPASGYVAPAGALAIGGIAGIACYWAVLLKGVLGYDDSLDAFGIHGVGGFLGAILTGAFVSLPLWVYGSELSVNDFPGRTLGGEGGAAKTFDLMGQLKWQAVAAVSAGAYAFLVTAVLVVLIDKTIGFTVSPKDEADGLDLSQHGEVGMDVGQIEEEATGPEPKAADAPPPQSNGAAERFTVFLDGADPKEVHRVWSALCEPKGQPADPNFLTVYRHLTTMAGTRFRFRGGDPVAMKDALAALFEDGLQYKVKAHVER